MPLPEKKNMIRTIINCMFLAGIALVASAIGYHIIILPYQESKQAGEIIDELTDRYDLVVRYDDPENFHIPPQMQFDKHGVQLIEADHKGALIALKGVKRALEKYPKDLVKKNLTAVFIPGFIKTHNIKIDGTYLNSWIYVSADIRGGQKSILTFSEIFHHELSSLLFHNYEFPIIQWHFSNEPEFKYLENYMDMLQAGNNPRDPKEAHLWYKAGFVSDYGMTTMENDVNTYAELAMEHPAELVKLADQYPKIARKAKLLVEFYSGLSPKLCAYFKSANLVDKCDFKPVLPKKKLMIK